MPNGLARVFPAYDKKSNIGIGQDVFDHALDAKVFGMERADNGHTIGRAIFEA